MAAHLDYSINEMASFLSTMACGIMAPNSTPAQFSGFSEFVARVLTATRLPRATIVLSLVYLSKRWALGNVPCIDPRSESSRRPLYVMLVVALLLANKFHDDNTFTNKSWFDATGIPIADITTTEAAWLCMIKWSLHLNDKDLKGWDKWNHCWNVYAHGQDPAATSSSATESSPVSPPSSVRSASSSLSSNAPTMSPQSSISSPSRPSYTVPRWYEIASRTEATGRRYPHLHYPHPQHQQHQQHHVPHDHWTNSYYVSAYNQQATCTCNMCSFEPVSRRPAPLVNVGWAASSVAAC